MWKQGGLDLGGNDPDTLEAALCFPLPYPQLILALEEVAPPLVTNNCSLYVQGYHQELPQTPAPPEQNSS